MNYLNKIFISLFIVLFFSTCSSVEITKEKPDINQIKNHSEFKIILQENHSEGYSWHLNQNYDKKMLSFVNSVWHGKDKGLYFHFKTLSAGQTELIFIKRKYSDTTEVKIFVINILDE